MKKDNEEITKYAKDHNFTPSTDEYVNETDGRIDEPQDRFERGETFMTDPILARDEEHIGFSMQEDKPTLEKRPEEYKEGEGNYNQEVPNAEFESTETREDEVEQRGFTNTGYSETTTEPTYQTDSMQSPGADPNLGPAPFAEELNEEPTDEYEEEADESGFAGGGHGNGNAFSQGTDSLDDETFHPDEEIKTQKVRDQAPPSNRLF